MELLIKNFDKNICILKPVVSRERNIESIIARVKMIIIENHEQKIALDLRKINFLDSIKIATIVGTYHFLDFSERKIYMMVSNEEIKKAVESLSFNNIEILVGYDEVILAGIA